MPQMAPLMWFYLYFFFLTILFLFLAANLYIKPFETTSDSMESYSSNRNHWKL